MESSSSNTRIISVILQGHEGVPSDHLYRISPQQVVSGAELGAASQSPLARAVLRLLYLCQVVPAGGSSTISISFTPMVLDPDILHKVKCVGYALGFMSLDNEVSPPGLGRGHSHCLSPG